MTKQEAADHLDVSVRALERYTQQSRIAARYEKGRTRPTIVYDEGEVERFKTELGKVKHRPALESARAEVEGTFEAGAGLNFANDANLASTLATSGDIAPMALLFAQFVHAVRGAQGGAPLELGALPALSGNKEEMADTSKRAAKAPTPTADKILLGVEDAMSLTTLSRAVIVDAVKTGQLPAQKFGRAWKIKRRDLDLWIDHL